MNQTPKPAQSAKITTEEFNSLPAAVYKRGPKGRVVIDKKATKEAADRHYKNR